MDISPDNALAIVTEISSLLGQHVNLFDDTGRVIASTDRFRIGTWHGGAARIIDERLPELVVARDDEYPGARRGLNLPVALDGVVVGVVGITGEYHEVVTYGHVVQKMTEILLRENRENQARMTESRIRQRFLDQWLVEGVGVSDDFAQRGQRLGIDVERRYWVSISQIVGVSELGHTVDGQERIDRVTRLVRQHADGTPGVLLSVRPSRLVLLWPADAHGAGEVLGHLRALDATVAARVGLRLASGLGDDAADARRGLDEADRALHAARRRGVGALRFSDVALEFVLADLTPASRDAFLARVFRGVKTAHLPEVVRTLEAYFACDGSLADAAERLFVHRNTLGGRLDRLQQLTGFNPRSRADGALFFLAMQLLRRQAPVR